MTKDEIIDKIQEAIISITETFFVLRLCYVRLPDTEIH